MRGRGSRERFNEAKQPNTTGESYLRVADDLL